MTELERSFLVSITSLPKEEQTSCNHEWGETVNDYEEKELWEVRSEWGELYPLPTGKYKKVPCFSHTCIKCGYKEYVKDKVQIKTKKRIIYRTKRRNNEV